MVCILYVIILLSASLVSAVDTGTLSSCFVPAATATKPALRSFKPGPSRSCTRLSMTSSTNQEKADRKNNARNYTSRIPRHQEEAVGITSGLGLWGEIRRRAGRRRRTVVKEKWNSLRMKRSGRRRKILASRFQNYLSRNKIWALEERNEQMEEDDDDDDDLDNEEIADTNCQIGLDSMLARSGVLRTRIRLRQESLTDLQQLMRDVKLELNRMEWKNEYGNRNFMYGQTDKKEVVEENELEEVMNENRLAGLNQKWKEQQSKRNHAIASQPNVEEEEEESKVQQVEEEEPYDLLGESQLDLMKKRSLKLESSILLDRIRLQRLERRIVCFETDELGTLERVVGNTLYSLNGMEFPENNPITAVQRQAKKFANTFGESTSVLVRKLDRVQSKSGANNREYASVMDFAVQETAAGVRIVGNLLSNPDQLYALVDPDTPTLVPHLPAILGRLDRLESHVAPILSRVLNNKQHLRTIEPYLDEVLERFDDIEPHLPWILDHVDTLAPYTGLLLKHIDELLLYAEVDEYEAGDNSKKDNYAFAEQLLPYLEVYVSQLDLVGPHLPLLRPHLPLMLKHNRIKILSPHVGVLFAKGYTDLSASANMDILLFYFGWALRIPFVPRFFFSLPGSPGLVSFLANRLPKRLVRGRCCDVTCYVDGDYGEGWNELTK